MFLGLGAGAKPPKYGTGLAIFYDLGTLVMLCKINPIVCFSFCHLHWNVVIELCVDIIIKIYIFYLFL